MITLCQVCHNSKLAGKWKLCKTSLKMKYRAVTCPACQKILDRRFSGRLVITLPNKGQYLQEIRVLIENTSLKLQEINYFNRVGNFQSSPGKLSCETLTQGLPYKLAKEILCSFEGKYSQEKKEEHSLVNLTLTHPKK